MGFKVLLDGELVKEYEGDHKLVTRVSLNSAQGEAGVLSVPNTIDSVNIIVTIRDTTEEVAYSDLIDENAMAERAARVEKASTDRVKEGRKLQADMDKAAAAAAAPEEKPTAKKETANL